MANLLTLRKRALSRYGLSRFGDEDPQFPTPVLNELINAGHRELAERSRCYRQTQSYNVTADTATISLDCNVIDVDVQKVRISINSVWRTLEFVHEDDLYSQCGALEEADSADPSYFYFKVSDTLDAQRVIGLYPPPQTTVSSGLKVECYVYPSAMSSDTDTPALQPAEHERIIPFVCRGMAEIDLGRGRPDAPNLVAYWEREAEEAAMELKRVLERFAWGGPRKVRFDDYHGEAY